MQGTQDEQDEDGNLHACSQPLSKKEMKKTRKKRDPNFTRAEEFALVDAMQRHGKLIKKKYDNNTTNVKKQKAWAAVVAAVNSVSTFFRSLHAVRIKWEQMQYNAKKRNVELIKEVRKTGGGPPTCDVKSNPLDARVLMIMGERCIYGMKEGLDSLIPPEADEDEKETEAVAGEDEDIILDVDANCEEYENDRQQNLSQHSEVLCPLNYNDIDIPVNSTPKEKKGKRKCRKPDRYSPAEYDDMSEDEANNNEDDEEEYEPPKKLPIRPSFNPNILKQIAKTSTSSKNNAAEASTSTRTPAATAQNVSSAKPSTSKTTPEENATPKPIEFEGKTTTPRRPWRVSEQQEILMIEKQRLAVDEKILEIQQRWLEIEERKLEIAEERHARELE